MKKLLCVSALLLSACASAPQPHCIPPELVREPEASGGFGPVPRSDSRAQDEYDRCRAREEDARLEARLREEEALARKREAEKLERELREQQENKGKDE